MEALDCSPGSLVLEHFVKTLVRESIRNMEYDKNIVCNDFESRPIEKMCNFFYY